MYKEISANKRKTVLIMAGFMVLVAGLAWIFGEYTGSPGLTYGVIIGALIYALISYFAGSRMALAINGAHEIKKQDNPRLWRMVENLAITEGMPMPKVYIMDDPAPNAFATGRNPKTSSVAVTTGLLDIMEDNELEGVLAHELGHIKNYDIRVTMIAFALVAVVALIADIMLRMTWFRSSENNRNSSQLMLVIGVAAAILAPIAASLIQLAVSRRREFLADATGALTTRYPEGLARALEKIGSYNRPMRRQNSATAHLFFANPLRGKNISSLFSTHPPIEERIRRLRSMGASA